MVLAAIATFVALAGIAVAIHGMLFNQDSALHYGAAAIALGVTACAVALNVWPKDEKQ
ncbi:FIG00454648: hypothetical protein [Burkholderia singularis]|uniref:DUF2964 domain-containing protein n=1 Tax=Burkholderia singularis TaxID=1503053 RepID=A0A238HCF6_9BURK|nr:FIG00454648: hypothetical protein [Burkholderia singularis]